jgi:hypothetical protein
MQCRNHGLADRDGQLCAEAAECPAGSIPEKPEASGAPVRRAIIGGAGLAAIMAMTLGAGMEMPLARGEPLRPRIMKQKRFKRTKPPPGPAIGRTGKKHRVKGLRP